MNKILSIIIPTYNMERYLQQCLDSLIVPENMMDWFEVLVINDGSKDDSSAIGHEYELRFPQTFRVIDKENGNYGSCINVGIKEAIGNYVKVLDADDSFDNNHFIAFLRKIHDVDADLIISSFVTVREDGSVIRTHSYKLPMGKVYDVNHVINTCDFKKMQMHAITYARRIFEGIQYRQSEGISYTDQEWIFTPMFYVRTVFVSDIVLYKYLIGREGQTMNPAVKLRSISHTCKGIIKMAEDYGKMDFKDRDNSYFKKILMNRLSYIYKNYIIKNHNLLPAKDLENFEIILKQTNKDVFEWTNEIGLLFGLPKFVKIWRKNDSNILIICLRFLKSTLH